jgi:nucleoid DNA-binding protein
MTKLDISHKIAQQAGVDQVLAKQIVQMTLDAIVEALATAGRIELRDFGVFEVRVAKACKARNPRTGAEVSVPEKRRVYFKTGKLMKARVRNGQKAIGMNAGPTVP